MYACYESANTFSNFATVGSQPLRIMQEASFGTSNKGGKILIGEHQYEYRKRKSVGLNSYWECRHAKKKSCKATAVTTIIDQTEFMKFEKGEHPVVLRC